MFSIKILLRCAIRRCVLKWNTNLNYICEDTREPQNVSQFTHHVHAMTITEMVPDVAPRLLTHTM